MADRGDRADPAASLLSLVGASLGTRLVPPRRTPTWQAARAVLEAALLPARRPAPMRSWQALWHMLHRTAAPVQTTWANLLGRATVGDLREGAAAAAPMTAHCPIFGWNIRWIVDHLTPLNDDKKAVVAQQILAGKIVALVETHWDAAAFGVWRRRFPIGTVLPNLCRVGPGGGPSGGTAFVLPASATEIGHRVLVPGCAACVDIRPRQGPPFTLIAIYLPNGAQVEVMEEIAAFREFSLPVFVTGDINCELTAPRDAREGQCLDTLYEWLSAIGATPLHTGPTRKAGRQESTIDLAAAPTAAAWRWNVATTRHRDLSDHASLTMSVDAKRTCNAWICSPAAFKKLPTEAITDLRHRFHCLATRFGVPAGDIACPPLRSDNPAPVGELHRDDPALAAAVGQQDGDGDQGHSTAADTRVPWAPALARWGHSFMQGMLRSWWKAWRSASSCDPVGLELQGALRNDGLTPLSVVTKDWAASWLGGEPPEAIDAHTASTWIGVLQGMAITSMRHGKRSAEGPSAARQRLHRDFAVGRTLLKGKKSSPGVRDSDGVLHTDPVKVDRILWDSRKSIWTAAPGDSPAGDALLAAYFAKPGRSADLPASPCPLVRELAGLVLAGQGSAPGLDGQPYEVYHCGVAFVVHLLGQAMHAAHHNTVEAAVILGPAEDLSVWIPKKEGADKPNGQRPLQLPTTLRRLFGAAMTELVGPRLERGFSRHQAAIRGGSCGPNVARAYAHLEGSLDPPGLRVGGAPPDVGPLWHDVLGPAAIPCLRLCEGAHESCIASAPAAVLADQSKAFERLSLTWLWRVLGRWNLPRWIFRAFTALTRGRRVRSACAGATARALRCGIGMGGPQSPFLWNLAYDPIVDGLADAVLARTPTYVDDLCGLTYGPAHTLRMLVFLIVAGHAAGLVTDVHTCSRLLAKTGRRRAAALLVSFPVTIAPAAGGEDAFQAQGLPGHFLFALLAIHLGPVWCETAFLRSEPCTCAVKTVVVPFADTVAWAEALKVSPYGHTSVVPRGPYLGISLGSASRYDLPLASEWNPDAWIAIQTATWAGAVDKIAEDVRTITGATSWGLRASLWRTYTAPKIPYPASLCAPAPAQERHLTRLAGTVFPTHTWAVWDAPFALGAAFGTPGAPRHPFIIADVAAICAWLRNGGWGPANAPRRGRDAWETCLHWAGHTGDGDPLGPCKRHIRELAAGAARGDAHTAIRSCGPHLYKAAWHAKEALGFFSWAGERSHRRRWWSTDGHEWALFAKAPHFSAAYHILRLFLGGIGPPRQSRGESSQEQRRCSTCGAEGPRFGWLAPADGTAGTAWCTPCAPAAATAGHAWACTLGLLTGGDAAAHDEANSLRAAHPGGASLSDPAVPRRGQQCCPLCCTGEFSSEHLLVWCPAVARAWGTLCPPRRPVLQAIASPGDTARLLATFLHQVSFLACSLAGQGTLDWTASSGTLVRATRKAAARGERQGEEDGNAAQDDEEEPDHAALCVRPWHPEKPECTVCAAHRPPKRLVTASARPRFDVERPALLALRRVWPVATQDVAAGQVIACLHGWHEAGVWPFRARSWWPRPGKGGAALANAKWDTLECPRCHHWTAVLRADKGIKAMEGIVTRSGSADPILGPAEDTPFEATFDGATVATPAGRVAGAAAVLWGPPNEHGERPKITTTFVALPAEGRSEIAEAWGARTAAAAAAVQTTGGVAIAGDNPSVVRYCAGTGNLTSPIAHEVLDHAIGQLAAQGRHTQWILIPRRLNHEAHQAARTAASKAADLIGQGLLNTVSWSE